MVIAMAIFKVKINGTYEYAEGKDKFEAVEKAKKRYLGQLKDKPFVIQVEEVKQL